MIKINRPAVLAKYDNHCGYCGKVITLKEMQVDHIIPKWLLEDNQYKNEHSFEEIHSFDNLMPTCRRCNHYKRGDNLEGYREKIKTLHKRACAHYIGMVAIDYGIVEIRPWDGKFYYEKVGS